MPRRSLLSLFVILWTALITCIGPAAASHGANVSSARAQRALAREYGQGGDRAPEGRARRRASGGIPAPLAKIVADERYSIVTDHLGTPRAMFDIAGDEVWSGDVDAYGGLRNERGLRRACPFRWPGQYEDAETGLYYNRFRYYDPQAGTYVSQDPIGLAGGLSLHGYPRDPLGWFDPLGMSPCGGKTQTAIAPYWPPDRGFLGGQSSRRHLMPGELIDRFGYEGGTFVSPKGIPYPMRALPPGTNAKPYKIYRVKKPIEVTTGDIAPAFGEPGMGVQHELPTSVARLLRHGFLEEVPP